MNCKTYNIGYVHCYVNESNIFYDHLLIFIIVYNIWRKITLFLTLSYAKAPITKKYKQK